MARIRRLLPLVAWSAALLAVAVTFTWLGRGAMAGPDLLRPGTWSAWAAARTAPEAAFAVLRLLVVALASYLLVVTALAVVAGVWRARRLVTAVEILTLPMVRRTIHGFVGIGLAGASVAGVGAGGAAGSGGAPRAPVVQVASTSAASASAASTAPVEAAEAVDHGAPVSEDGGAPMRRLPDGAEEPPVMRLVTGSPDAPVTAVAEPPAPADASAPADAGEWEIRPGDHLWSVAEHVVTDSLGRDATDAEVAVYFGELVEANASRLADPTNPDLVFPGQRVVLPAPDVPSG